MKAIDDNKRNEIISCLINTPEVLTAEDVKMIQDDEELRELYQALVLCKEASVMNQMSVPDVEDELARFKANRKKVIPLYKRWNVFMRIAAIFAGVAVSTLVVAAVLEYQGVDLFHFAKTEVQQDEETALRGSTDVSVAADSPVETVNEKDLNYDNVTLEEIMKNLAEIYGVNVTFENDNVKELRLYVKIEQGKTIREVVEQLGAFEKFDISVNGNTVIVK